jgi:hypothetical protein
VVGLAVLAAAVMVELIIQQVNILVEQLLALQIQDQAAVVAGMVLQLV